MTQDTWLSNVLSISHSFVGPNTMSSHQQTTLSLFLQAVDRNNNLRIHCWAIVPISVALTLSLLHANHSFDCVWLFRGPIDKSSQRTMLKQLCVVTP